MLRGLYSSYAGMEAMLLRQEVVANNLANASSAGFKQDFAVIQSYPRQAITRIEGEGRQRVLGALGDINGGVLVGDVFTDYSHGVMEETGVATDLALGGEGFFAVAGRDGVRYTRAGNFRLDAEGMLVTTDGFRVLGEGGGSLNAAGGQLAVSRDGSLTVDGEKRGRLLVVTFPEGARLDKGGDGLIATVAAGKPAGDAQVEQGSLETSNVEAIKQMVEMMEGFRAYESNQKIIRAQDATLERAVNQVGKV